MARRSNLKTDIKPVSEFRANAAENELLSDVRTAIRQIESGSGVPDDDAKAELRGRFSR